MKIAIITIATGKYKDFISPLLWSMEEFMLKDYNRTFGLLTDLDEALLFVPNLPHPLNSLLRFYYLNQIKLDEYDLVYYIDSDCEVVSEIGPEIFPDKKGQLVAVEHPWQGINSEIYERNPNSTAAVQESKGMHYFQGSFFGGYTTDFIAMSKELEKNINADLKKVFIAKWYDESHLNKYFIDHPPKQLHMGYAYPDPEIWLQSFPVEKKILHKNNATSPR